MHSHLRKRQQRVNFSVRPEPQDSIFQRYATEIQSSLQLQELVKSAKNQFSREQQRNNPEFMFFVKCLEGRVLCLPILLKVKDRKL
jgi:hypothetical protein